MFQHSNGACPITGKIYFYCLNSWLRSDQSIEMTSPIFWLKKMAVFFKRNLIRSVFLINCVLLLFWWVYCHKWFCVVITTDHCDKWFCIMTSWYVFIVTGFVSYLHQAVTADSCVLFLWRAILWNNLLSSLCRANIINSFGLWVNAMGLSLLIWVISVVYRWLTWYILGWQT